MVEMEPLKLIIGEDKGVSFDRKGMIQLIANGWNHKNEIVTIF